MSGRVAKKIDWFALTVAMLRSEDFLLVTT